MGEGKVQRGKERIGRIRIETQWKKSDSARRFLKVVKIVKVMK